MRSQEISPSFRFSKWYHRAWSSLDRGEKAHYVRNYSRVNNVDLYALANPLRYGNPLLYGKAGRHINQFIDSLFLHFHVVAFGDEVFDYLFENDTSEYDYIEYDILRFDD